MGQSLFSELLTQQNELCGVIGTLVLISASVGYLIARRACKSCGRILLETGESNTFGQIAGTWMHHHHRVELCGNLDCAHPLFVKAKSRPATKDEVLKLGVT
jgi:hypothetical protein